MLVGQQFFILGSMTAAFKCMWGTPKLSFLQFPGCVLVNVISLGVEFACFWNFLATDAATGVGG